LHPSLEGRPRGIRPGEQFERAVAVLDRSLPFDTHKIGILYVGPNQTTEEAILSNQTGSHLYLKVKI
jgi:tuberous sclerosis protein 2